MSNGRRTEGDRVRWAAAAGGMRDCAGLLLEIEEIGVFGKCFECVSDFGTGFVLHSGPADPLRFPDSVVKDPHPPETLARRQRAPDRPLS